MQCGQNELDGGSKGKDFVYFILNLFIYIMMDLGPNLQSAYTSKLD